MRWSIGWVAVSCASWSATACSSSKARPAAVGTVWQSASATSTPRTRWACCCTRLRTRDCPRCLAPRRTTRRCATWTRWRRPVMPRRCVRRAGRRSPARLARALTTSGWPTWSRKPRRPTPRPAGSRPRPGSWSGASCRRSASGRPPHRCSARWSASAPRARPCSPRTSWRSHRRACAG